MFRKNRNDYILNYLADNKIAKVSFLSEKLGVTQETIRRDLEQLEKEGTVKRIHGGAILQTSNTPEQGFVERDTINVWEKEQIAQKAMEFIQEGDFIALDVSTTNTALAKELVNHFENLSVLTNSIVIATLLATKTNFNLLIPGGTVKNSELCIYGASAIDYINRYQINKFFMSVSSVSMQKGFMDYGQAEYDIKMAMYRNANQIYVVADHTKFETTSMLKISDVYSVNGIITDSSLRSDIAENYMKEDFPLYF